LLTRGPLGRNLASSGETGSSHLRETWRPAHYKKVAERANSVHSVVESLAQIMKYCLLALALVAAASAFPYQVIGESRITIHN